MQRGRSAMSLCSEVISAAPAVVATVATVVFISIFIAIIASVAATVAAISVAFMFCIATVLVVTAVLSLR